MTHLILLLLLWLYGGLAGLKHLLVIGMGSVLISDVGNHFLNNMLGANSHIHARHDIHTASVFATPASFSRVYPPTSSYSHKSEQTDGVEANVRSTTESTRQSRNKRRNKSISSYPTSDSVASTDGINRSQSPMMDEKRQCYGNKKAQSGSAQDIDSSESSSSPQSSPAIAMPSAIGSHSGSPQKIRVNSLSHIQSFFTDQLDPGSQSPSDAGHTRRAPDDTGPQYEISNMPVTDIIEMVAGLLTKITTTNDRQHDHLHRQVPSSEGQTGLSQQTTSVLAFHGKNVPSITILSYLTRIHKYCPTTYEVFLSLLIYFDRMTERVNTEPINSMRQGSNGRRTARNATQHLRTPSSQSLQKFPAKSEDPLERSSPYLPNYNNAPGSMNMLQTSGSSNKITSSLSSSSFSVDSLMELEQCDLSHFFVVDSFNIHRLVIAGITCASKFFSDVFYTNSRYAKVSTCRKIWCLQ